MEGMTPFPISPQELTGSHVRGLPLHDVTKHFGTLGLQLRLADTLASTGLDEVREVVWATHFGLMLHANDTRTNGMYADHLLRVTLRILERYHITDPELIASAMLHDGPEDHAKDIVAILSKEVVQEEQAARDRAFELLTPFIGAGAVHIVQSVTNPIIRPGQDKLEVYHEHTRTLVEKEPKGRVLKLSDFTDNAVGNHHTVGERQHDLDYKYVGEYRTHLGGLFMPDSLITGQERLYALKQLNAGHARALARLALRG